MISCRNETQELTNKNKKPSNSSLLVAPRDNITSLFMVSYVEKDPYVICQLTFCMLGNFSCINCCQLTFLKTISQEHYQSAKRFGSRSGPTLGRF